VSEYQCYEFVALDRPLTSDEMAELRSISTRADISPTRFWNEYQWGDLKADPKRLLARYFEAFLYFANWASHRFMLRLPASQVDLRQLKPHFHSDCDFTAMEESAPFRTPPSSFAAPRILFALPGLTTTSARSARYCPASAPEPTRSDQQRLRKVLGRRSCVRGGDIRHSFSSSGGRSGIGYCAAIFEDAEDLWEEVDRWVGRRVLVQRTALEATGVGCTQIHCGGPNRCCNSCQGWARPVGTQFRRIVGVDCLGNECEPPECGTLGARGFRLLPSGDFELGGRVEREREGFVLEDVELRPAPLGRRP
jgi:hypothetical protein